MFPSREVCKQILIIYVDSCCLGLESLPSKRKHLIDDSLYVLGTKWYKIHGFIDAFVHQGRFQCSLTLWYTQNLIQIKSIKSVYWIITSMLQRNKFKFVDLKKVFCRQALCPFCVCVSVCLKDQKWTQTDTKVTLHPPPTTIKLFLVSNEWYCQVNTF